MKRCHLLDALQWAPISFQETKYFKQIKSHIKTLHSFKNESYKKSILMLCFYNPQKYF